MEILETVVGSFLFALIFLFGNKLEGPLGFSRRRVLSAAAGVSISYGFIRMLPELNEAGRTFEEATAHRRLLFPDLRVYGSALFGFVLYYGLEHLVKWSRVTGRRNSPDYGGSDPVFLLHIGGFALYGWLVSYLMVRSISETPIPILLYTLAMGLHFLALDNALGREHGNLYARPGRQILAAAVLAGWLEIGGQGLYHRDHYRPGLSVDCLSMVLPGGGASGCRHPGSYTVSVNPRSREPDGKAKIERQECRGRSYVGRVEGVEHWAYRAATHGT